MRPRRSPDSTCRARHSKARSTRTSPRAVAYSRRRWPASACHPTRSRCCRRPVTSTSRPWRSSRVIDHGIQNHYHPDVISVIDSEFGRITISHTDRTRRESLDKHLAHVGRRPCARTSASYSTRQRRRLSPPCGNRRSKHRTNAPMNASLCSPNLRLDGTGPASKVLSHGFELGQRTTSVGALFLEPAKCRCAVASRCANGIRPGAAAARVADSRLHFRASRRRVDVRPFLVQARPDRSGSRRSSRTATPGRSSSSSTAVCIRRST